MQISKITVREHPEPRPLRVAAYCRVSTTDSSQRTSITSQRLHYEELIGRHLDWVPAGIYCEEGVTGTRKEARPQLTRLLQDCRDGRVDLILTKSISRFARSTSDCLELVRLLAELGISVYFEKENIRTGSMESEFLLTLLASFAEEESHSISENEQWSIRRRFRAGTYRLSKAPYGYRLLAGELLVEEQEAAVVRGLFAGVLAGKGTILLARELNGQNVPTGTKTRDGIPAPWTSSHILSMLRNPVYSGDLLFQKTFHDRQFRRHFNYGEKPQYYIEDHHPAIVSREVFALAQQAVRQRGREKGNLPASDKRARNSPHQNRYCFSGKVFCGNCGSTMHRKITTLAHSKRVRWCCREHLRDPASCGQKKILEENLKNTFVTMLNKLSFAQGLILEEYAQELRTFSPRRSPQEQERLNLRMRKIIDERYRLFLDLQENRIDPVRFRQRELELDRAAAQLDGNRDGPSCAGTPADEAERFCRFVRARDHTESTRFPETAFEEFVEKVLVYDRRRFVFYLSCGLVFTEEIEGPVGR